jgi:hypothetical protein
VSGTLPAVVKLLQLPTSSDNLATIQAACKLMAQLLKLCGSGQSCLFENAGVQGAGIDSNGGSTTRSRTSKAARSPSGPGRAAGCQKTTTSTGTGHVDTEIDGNANPERMKSVAVPASGAATAAVMAVSDAAVEVLLKLVRQRDECVWLYAAAALGHVLKMPNADAERWVLSTLPENLGNCMHLVQANDMISFICLTIIVIIYLGDC